MDVIDPTTGLLLRTLDGGAQSLVNGANGTTFGSPQVAQGIVWSTGQVIRGRRVIGRTFLSPLSATFLGNLVPPANAITQAGNFAGALIGTVGTTDPWPLVWARPTVSAPGAAPQITAGAGALSWFTLRSRRD